MRRAAALVATLGVFAPFGCDLYDARVFGSICEHDEDCEAGYVCRETTRGRPGACEGGSALFVCTKPCRGSADCAGLPAPAGKPALCMPTCVTDTGSKTEVPCAPDPAQPSRVVCPGMCFFPGE